MANLYPYIFSNDAKKQAQFYVKALAGEIILMKTYAELPQAPAEIKDKILHLRIKALGQVFFMSDLVDHQVERGNGLDLTLEFKEAREAQQVFDGLAEGGKVLMPLEKQFWGSISGMVQDPFGVRWQISVEF